MIRSASRPSTISELPARAGRTARLAAASRIERRIPHWPLDRIVRLQQRRVREAVAYAYDNVPFYRRTMDSRSLRPGDFASAEDLARLPLIDGAILAANPDDFTAERFRHEGREVFNTSGSTTGVRKRICWDHESLMRRFAQRERDRVVVTRLAGERWTGAMLREFIVDERARTLASRLLGVGSEAHQRLQILPAGFASRTARAIAGEHSLIRRRPLHYHHLSPAAPLDLAAAQIRAIEPRIIFSFGSYLEQFLRYLAHGRVTIPMPRIWVYLGDGISDAARELADELRCPLYSVYCAVETGPIGFQCELRDGFHLNVDLCAVRIVDGEGRTLPPGEAGEIVVSVLNNRATALLNYRMGDRGVLAGHPCPCGRSLPLLSRFEGRQSEMVQLADGRAISSLMLEGLFKQELRRAAQAQIEQVAPGELCWNLVPFADTNCEELRQAFVARAERTLGPDTMLTVRFDQAIPRTREGKFLRAVVKRQSDDDPIERRP
jgi:phenylacetate-CoA ligase